MGNARRAVEVAEDYYDSPDADNFYSLIWGGEDIHIGLYDAPDGDIRTASRKTVEKMAAMIGGLGSSTRVLDIGAGYGGAARYIARAFGAQVTCLNLSEVENARNENLTEQQGLSNKVRVLHGSFEDIPEPDNSFDVVWSQDAILHSGDRRRVLQEVSRVLKPGGVFIFTDPMQADEISDPAALQPIYDRLHLQSLASIAFYRRELKGLGFEEGEIVPMVEQLRAHYARVRAELAAKRGDLSGKISNEYVDRMLAGLQHWVDGADKGMLAWGILKFRKS